MRLLHKQLIPCSAIDVWHIQEKRLKMVCLGNGVGDKNGKWKNWSNVSTIKGINIKEGGMLIITNGSTKDGIVIGFKTRQ